MTGYSPRYLGTAYISETKEQVYREERKGEVPSPLYIPLTEGILGFLRTGRGSGIFGSGSGFLGTVTGFFVTGTGFLGTDAGFGGMITGTSSSGSSFSGTSNTLKILVHFN